MNEQPLAHIARSVWGIDNVRTWAQVLGRCGQDISGGTELFLGQGSDIVRELKSRKTALDDRIGNVIMD